MWILKNKKRIMFVLYIIILVQVVIKTGDLFMNRRFEDSDNYNFMQDYIVNYGKKIYYYQNEYKPNQETVVFISGSGVSSTYTDMYCLWSRLENKVNIIFYDRPGMGKSEINDELNDIDDIVKNLEQVLNSSDSNGPYILVAHSLGALEAVRYTQQYPEKVKGIVFIDGISPGYATSFHDPLKYVCSLMGGARKLGLIRLVSMLPRGQDLFKSQADIPDSMQELEINLICRNYWNKSLIAERRKVNENGKKILDTGRIGGTKIIVMSALKNTMKNWTECQEELTRLSDYSEQFFYDSGHFLHHKYTNEVIDKIETMFE